MEIFTEAINGIQTKLVEKVPGIESAPVLAEYPAALDTMLLPIGITHQLRESEFPLHTVEGPIHLAVMTAVYVQSYNQEFFGNVMQQVYDLESRFRTTFLDDNFYANQDEQKWIIDQSELQVWLNLSQAMRASGYQLMEYPMRSDRWYHGFTMTFAIVVHDHTCDVEDEFA